MIDPDRVRAELSPSIDAFVEAIRSAAPGLRVDTCWRANRSFPVGCTVSVSEDDAAGDELVVLTVAVWTIGTSLRLSSDLARGDGVVLEDGPLVELAEGSASDEIVAGWIREVTRFVGDSIKPAVRTALRSGD